MHYTRWLKRLAICGLAFSLVGGLAVFAAPPGTIDGKNIPSDFGAATLQAQQENKTGFGDQTVTPGGFTNGSELDALYLATDGTGIKVGITGNLDQPNHIHIFIGNTGGAGLGQQELKAQWVDGPPFTIQNMSQLVVLNTNGTPNDTGDDFCELTSNGTILPCVADYAISVDAFVPNLSVSEYVLNATSIGMAACGGTPMTDLYATRTFVTQTPLTDTDGLADNDQGFGYAEIGLNDTNVAGVTSTDGSTALSATTGLEMTIPYARLGLNGTEAITMLVTLTGDSGYVSAQMLPPHPTCTTEGDRPDLSTLGNCLTVNLAALPAWTGGANGSDGIINPADYGGGPAVAVQNCPTDFGDKQVDPGAVTLTGGSELDELYVTNDNEFLYVGLTGNLEANANGLLLFLDTVPGGQGSATNPLNFTPTGNRVNGMNGSLLPKDPGGAELEYDYAYEINGTLGTAGQADTATYYVDMRRLLTNTSQYMGSNMVNSNGDEFNVDPGNSNGFTFAYNFLNEDGVPGCGNLEACDVLSNGAIAAMAATASYGFEFRIPLADVGLTAPLDATTNACIWAFVTNGDGGYGSDQSLPTLRDPTGAIPGNPSNSVENAGGSPGSPAIDFSNDGIIANCEFFPPDDPDCQFAYFARAACVELQPSAPSSPVFMQVTSMGTHNTTPQVALAKSVDPTDGATNDEGRVVSAAWGNLTVEVTFEKTISAASLVVNPAIAGVTATADGSSTVVISYPGSLPTDETCYNFNLAGTTATDGGVFGSGGEDTDFCLCYNLGDVDGDGTVLTSDKNKVLGAAQWGKSIDTIYNPPTVPAATDTDRDGTVLTGDKNIVLGASNWGHSPAPCP